MEPRLRIGRALVGFVAAGLALEVNFRVAPFGRRAAVVLALEALVRGPRINQCAVNAEVLVAREPGPARGVLDPLEEHPHQFFVEQPLAVGAEGRVVPHPILKIEAHEPAAEHRALKVLDASHLGSGCRFGDGLDRTRRQRRDG